MSRLVRLYPQAWRDRYGAEFASLLDERPPGLRDVADTLRGAADAHLHPHLADPTAGAMPRTHRIPGLLALAAGGLWCAIFIAAAMGTWEAWGFLWLCFFAMVASLPGDYMAAHGRQIALAIGVIAISYVAANLLPWAFAGIIAFGIAIVALGGMLALASIRAGIGARERWILFALTIGLQAIAAVPISIGLIEWSGSSDVLAAGLAVLPYGVAWALVGLRLAIRGSATFVEPLPSPTEPEVAAA